ncbi:reverse transcriptase domain-containing protein [Tanacetum coccineum]
MMRKFLSKYFPPLMVTKLRNEIMNFRQELNESLFEAWECYKLSIDQCPNHNTLLVTQIDTFYNCLTLRHRDTINVAAIGTFMHKTPEECYDLIENMTAHHNHLDTSATQDETSKTISFTTTTTESLEVVRQLEMMNKNFLDMMRQIQSVKSVNTKCETCGGPHSFTECPAVGGYTQKATYATTGSRNSRGNAYQPQGDHNMLRYRSNNYLGPPGFNQPNVQNNQKRYNQNLGYNQNRGNNFNQGNYQAPNNQNQVQPSNELSNYIKINETNMRAMQNLITIIKTEMKNNFETSMAKQSNELKNMMASFFQMQSPLGSGSLPSNTIANPRGDLKAITTLSGVSYDGPTIPPTISPLPKEVECEPEATKDKVQTINLGSTAHVQPSVIQVPILKPDVAPKTNPNLLHFDLSFEDALLHIPKFASTFKSLLSNKEKLFKFVNTPLNENCSAVHLKKLPEKHGDPDRFLIPCDFPELDKCLALADLGASINLMPLSIWKKLSLSELTLTRMTLELANRSIAYPVGVSEDVFVKVGKFYFLTDFVVVDYDVDPRVPLILGRPFLRTARALIDVHGEELILRNGNEQLIIHADNTSKHPHKHRINFINITCEDCFYKVLKFKKSNHPSSGSTTPFSDSLLEEFADELALLDPFPLGNKDDNFDLEAELSKNIYLLNQDLSTDSSPKSDIKIIDPILERFTDKPAHIYSPSPGDDNDDLFMTSLLDLPTESDEVIKSSVEDLVPIPSESEDTSNNNRRNFIFYSNPLFEFDDEYISSDVNPLFNEVIESEDSYVSNFYEPVLPVTPFSDANEDECFDPGGDIDKIDAFLDIDVSIDFEDSYYESEGDIIYLESLLISDTIPNLLPEVFFDHDPRSLTDEHDNNNLKSMVKVFDLGIQEKIISLTYVRITFEDRHYFSLKIFLPFLTYLVNSLFLLSFGSEDTIFDPDIFAFGFYSLEPVVSHGSGTFMIVPDYEDSRAHGFIHRPLELQSLACSYMGI